VHNGVALDKFAASTPSNDYVYRQYSIPRHKKIVVYMGHFHQRKGVHVLLQAARHIVHDQRRDDVHFLFLGTRSQDVASVRRVIDFSAIEPYITLGGYQDRVPDLLAGCSIGCVPTTGWDSFPLSPLEMQACGLPVVVSDCQGLPETIVPGTTGLVVPAGDHLKLALTILDLLDDDERRRHMGLAARQRIQVELTEEIQVNRLVTALGNAWDSVDHSHQ
jgi:glycosyltransferase involved in cell wall biosynthesis